MKLSAHAWKTFWDVHAWGMYLAGVLGVGLLLALVTGVLIDLEDLVRQFHQVRPHLRARVLWSDLHKVLGVMGLPFQVMVAFTGAYLCLAALLAAVFAGPRFGGDQAAVAAVWGGARDARATGRPAPTLDLDHLLARARVIVPGFQPGFIRVRHIGDAGATARIIGTRPDRLFALLAAP